MTKSKFGSKWLTASLAAIALSTGVASAEEIVRVDVVKTFDTHKAIETSDTIGLDVSLDGTFESASIDVTFQIDEMGTIQDVETGYSQKGWAQKFGQWLKGKLVDVLGGGSGGGGGGGGGQTCNVNVNIEGGTQGGQVNINIGNLNCGSQNGGSGGGNNGGGK